MNVNFYRLRTTKFGKFITLSTTITTRTISCNWSAGNTLLPRKARTFTSINFHRETEDRVRMSEFKQQETDIMFVPPIPFLSFLSFLPSPPKEKNYEMSLSFNSSTNKNADENCEASTPTQRPMDKKSP